MKKVKRILKKILIAIAVLIFNTLGMINCVNAVDINSADIKSLGDCGSLLKYKGVVVLAYYAQYEHNGVSYPAYCLNKTKQGVTDDISYSVSVQDAITDVKLWRIIINGYPYKTIQELGVANKEEAFTATKQAIYCYIHGNNPADYEPIGEAGQRTLNALNKILNDANNSKETQISNTINIIREDNEWKQDQIDKNYLSKTYSIETAAPLNTYKVNITRNNSNDLAGIKLTDEKNVEKQEFKYNEKFKIMIPIKAATEETKIKISVEAKVQTKPVLYGAPSDSVYQDYALTAATYEDGAGSIEDQLPINKTKLVVIKQDKDTKQKLQDVEFCLLDENKNVVYSALKTDKNGKIEIDNLIPGVYYLKEVNTKDGYIPYEQLIDLTLKLNQVVTITVNNTKETPPEITTDEKEIEVEQEEKETISYSNKETEIRNIPVEKEVVKKLPVTGM